MFDLYKRDTLKFTIEGSDIELDVTRLTATESLQLNSRISRIDSDLNEVEEQHALIEIYLDLLVAIATDIRGVKGLDSWPDDVPQRRQLLNLCGFEFVVTAAVTYMNSNKVQEDEEGK